MRLAVFSDFRIGVVQGQEIFDVTSVVPVGLDELPAQRMNWLITHWSSAHARVDSILRKAEPIPLGAVKLMAPNPAPPHVFAAPANYKKHIGELGDRAVTKKGRSAREQGFFLKAPGSIVGPGGVIALPRQSTRRFDHESELAVIIGRAGRDIPRTKAMEYVFGYSCLIDATMRIEPGEGEEERSMRKSFEGFTPLGPFLVTVDEIPEPSNLLNRLWVNGEIRQEANTRDMIVDIPELIELISSVLPLSPDDVIATGTPDGVGPFAPGDTVRIAIDQIGDMTLRVVERDVSSPRPY